MKDLFKCHWEGANEGSTFIILSCMLMCKKHLTFIHPSDGKLLFPPYDDGDDVLILMCSK